MCCSCITVWLKKPKQNSICLSVPCQFLLPLLLCFYLIYCCYSYNGACLCQANVELQSEHNFGMRVTGRTRGRTGLKVVLRVTDPDAGQLVGNLQELTDEIQIQVQHYVYSSLHGDTPAKSNAVNIISLCLEHECFKHCISRCFIKTLYMDYFAYHGHAPLLRLHNRQSQAAEQWSCWALEYLKLLTLWSDKTAD